MMDTKTILALGIVAVCAFLIGALLNLGGSGDESEAQASALPHNSFMDLTEESSDNSNDSLSGLFGDPNGIEPPTLPDF